MFDIPLPNLLLAIGILKSASIAYEILAFLNHFLLTKGYDLVDRYGEGSWALVTGSSDGIGAAYAKLLAQKGFNVCLVSRTKSKLEKVESDINKQSPNVKTRIVVADFSGDASLGFYRNILDQVQDLDISIVIANAGVLLIGSVEKTSASRQCGMVDVNMYHYVMMHKLFLPKLLRRTKEGKRCAMIGVSSAYYLRYFAPGMTVYSGTKALATYMSQGMSQELKDLGD